MWNRQARFSHLLNPYLSNLHPLYPTFPWVNPFILGSSAPFPTLDPLYSLLSIQAALLVSEPASPCASFDTRTIAFLQSSALPALGLPVPPFAQHHRVYGVCLLYDSHIQQHHTDRRLSTSNALLNLHFTMNPSLPLFLFRYERNTSTISIKTFSSAHPYLPVLTHKFSFQTFYASI